MLSTMTEKGAAVTLGLALICGIVACAVPAMYTIEISEITFEIGIWRTVSTQQGQDTWEDVECNSADTIDTDCNKAGDMKCKTSKAFIILGILSNAAAIVPLVLPPVPAIVGGLGAGFAIFSYMIVMSIFAANYNGDADTDSDCGSGYWDNEDAAYGASFFFLVIAFVLSGAGAGLSFMVTK